MRSVSFLLLSCTLLFTVSSNAFDFRIGLANIYFFGALFEDNVKEPVFGNKLKEPVERLAEIESDRMNLEYLSRYFQYLDSDVLAICEAPKDPKLLEQFSKDYLNDEYLVIHSSPVVKSRKYYFNQQVAAFVKKDMFLVRRYESLKTEDVTTSNQMYPFPGSITGMMEDKKTRVYWSRFPIEFDLALKSDPDHWYKFIVTYPKSKFARGEKQSLKARFQNYMQQKMIRNRVEEVASDFEDIIVLGDMNDDSGLDSYEEKLGKDSIKALYQGEDDPILVNPIRFRSGEGTYIYKGNPSVLDYIFVSRGMLEGKGKLSYFPKTFEHFHFFKTMVRNTKRNRPDRLKNRELFLSDHAPLTLEVSH